MGPGAPSHALLLSPEPQTHQFCSSSSSSCIPSNSSRTLRRAGNPPCHRPRLRGYPLTQVAPSPRTLRRTGTRLALARARRERSEGMPCPPRRKCPSLPGSLCQGKGGWTERGPHPVPPRSSCPVQRGGNIGETPNGSGVGWALPPPPGGARGGFPDPERSLPASGGEGGFAEGPLPTASGTPRVRGAGNPGYVAPAHCMSCTEKRAAGGGTGQAAPRTLSQVWGTPGMWARAHLGRFCQAEYPVIPQDPRGHRP